MKTYTFNIQPLLEMMGEAGKRLSEMNACEGAAGNLSICFRGEVSPQKVFSMVEEISLPIPVPELSGANLLVSGSGQRLKDIMDHPLETVGFLIVGEGGLTGKLFTSPQRMFQRLTSEFNSHLAVHATLMNGKNLHFHAIVHAQPPYLTYLSHLPQYQEESTLNQHLFRWQPETIIQFPEGFGVLPFLVPGSENLMRANVEALQHHKIALWCKHGVMACSDESILRAVDYIEYAEAAAKYEYMNLALGSPTAGLTVDELLQICQAFHVHQTIFPQTS